MPRVSPMFLFDLKSIHFSGLNKQKSFLEGARGFTQKKVLSIARQFAMCVTWRHFNDVNLPFKVIIFVHTGRKRYQMVLYVLFYEHEPAIKRMKCICRDIFPPILQWWGVENNQHGSQHINFTFFKGIKVRLRYWKLSIKILKNLRLKNLNLIWLNSFSILFSSFVNIQRKWVTANPQLRVWEKVT